ncbi:hypothetical protein BC943DRAFT_325479 [Umbelopsis sp. AD052]|nr:hypothetical protein BC943DRAFT_325479 [Umbelopsis sp. AD052]
MVETDNKTDDKGRYKSHGIDSWSETQQVQKATVFETETTPLLSKVAAANHAGLPDFSAFLQAAEEKLGSAAKFIKVIVAIVFLVWYIATTISKFRRQELTSDEAKNIILDTPNSFKLREYLVNYTSVAHVAGTESDRLQAEWTRDKLVEFGIPDVEIETYWPLLNYPKNHRVAIVSGPEHLHYEAKLREDVAPGDDTSKRQDDVPTFHGYSKGGNVTAPIIYVNYGRIEDFRLLASRGVQINGTIALVRYGENFRGLKVTAAEKFGCVGVLIYSDPIDDGPVSKPGIENPAKPYPEGPWRARSSVQRGSVQPFSLMAGDPLTPGYAAKENVTRLAINETIGIAKIPSMPISWEDAVPLFKALVGHGRVIESWKGGLDNAMYFYGPSVAEVNLVNEIENKITPIWNVIGKIQGREKGAKAIVLGNHRDAWVYGAIDPSSGSAIMLELARTFGILLKHGWKPRRTIIFASWDAEEYGMVGSTEWVEDHKEWLDNKAICYLNVDMAVSGPHFAATGSPSLNQLLYEVTKQVPDPKTHLSIYDTWLKDSKDHADEPFVGTLGSGSDYVAFVDHVGIASVDIRFTGEFGVYHSNYDSLYWMDHFGDPTYQYHVALTQIWGLMAFHLANDRLLNMNAKPYAVFIAEQYRILKKLTPLRDFSNLESAIKSFIDAADILDAQVLLFKEGRGKTPIGDINSRLSFFERRFIDPEGIQGRDWFKHVIIAPGLWTGYAAQTFPAIVEAIENGNETAITHTMNRAALYIEKAAKFVAGRKSFH